MSMLAPLTTTVGPHASVLAASSAAMATAPSAGDSTSGVR